MLARLAAAAVKRRACTAIVISTRQQRAKSPVPGPKHGTSTFLGSHECKYRLLAPECDVGSAALRRDQEFKTEIRKALQARLVPGAKNTLRLLAWTLAGRPDHTDQFPDLLVATFIDISDRAVTRANAHNLNRRDRMTSIERMLTMDDNFAEFQVAVMADISPAQIARASMTIFGWERITLIFDNVDRVPFAHQMPFMEMINDTHNALSGTCGTMVAIRRETLRQAAPRSNEKGDPIDIVAPNEARYPFLLFPDARPQHVTAILQRRYEFSMKLF